MPDNFKLTAPVAFLVYNRPAKTERVFEAIRRVRPQKFLVVADGPKNQEDEKRCLEVRSIIENGTDWPCELLKNYAPTNMGCKNRVSSGLNWVFGQVEEVIILEDDCLPDQSFFPFCQKLLEKYRHDQQVMHISGFNISVNDKKYRCPDSYYFSQIGLIAGWATWRRAWRYYDVNVSQWPEIKQAGLLSKILPHPAIENHYNHLFDQYHRQEVDSWDSQWYLTRWIQQGLSIVPKTNLVQNIGFDSEAAHRAIDPRDERANVPVVPLTFPLIHPAIKIINQLADAYTFKHYMNINHFWQQRWRWFLKSRFPGLYGFIKK